MAFDKWLLEFKSKGIGNPLMSECYEAGLQQNKSNPLMWICLICISGLYIINGIKSSK